MKKLCVIVLILILVSLTLAGCTTGDTPVAEEQPDVKASVGEQPVLPQSDGDDPVLSLSGEGLAWPADLSLSQLKKMDAGFVETEYSARNSWPTFRTYSVQGVLLTYLLEQVGITDEATLITITAEDGYRATFTREQIEESRYNFPHAADNSRDGEQEVPAVLAWSFVGDKYESEDALRNFVGQRSPSDVNTVVAVRDVCSIVVSTDPIESWSSPQYEINESGTSVEVTLLHTTMDSVQLYYTLDGSTPTMDSSLYNPSATYYQNELIVPIQASKGSTLSVIAFGYGKNPSEVITIEL